MPRRCLRTGGAYESVYAPVLGQVGRWMMREDIQGTPSTAPFTLRPSYLLVDALTRMGVVVRAIEGAWRRSHSAPMMGV